MIGLDDLLTNAALAGATDILLSPAPHVGKLIVRAAGDTLLSRVVDPGVLRSLSMQLGMRTGQPALLGGGSATLDASIASFELDVGGTEMRIRVIGTPTPSGPMVRLRLQSRARLIEALHQFRGGGFGGLGVLQFLDEESGVVFVAGPTSSGKTSALHHLTASLESRTVTLISEAHEFAAGDVLSVSEAASAQGVVVLDELDETDKLGLAMSLGRSHLVLATLVAPNLDAAVRRLRAATSDLDTVIGILRVDWDTSSARLRVPSYRWFPLEGRQAVTDMIPRAVLENMDDLASFQALAQLEAR